MMFHEMTIAGVTRRLPLCPLNEELYIAGFVMFGDVEITEACAKELLAKAPEFDVIVTAESKGIPLAYEMARQSGKDYVVLRKEPKLYMVDVIKTTVDSITTAHIQTLCIGSLEADVIRGKRVLIVDDVISTGGSLMSIEKILNKVGCDIVGKMAVLAEGDAIDRPDIIYLEELPLFNPDGTAK
ncbi:MAG: adenine phosphoribosyltransferase [Firmicutes bacterium]|nr:adenine phosphoribosyltransferase [Bacillota bacterium]